VAVQVVPARQTITLKLGYLRLKRLIDILFTLLILPFLVPVALVVALAIRLDSPGPVFFRQKRVGRNGHEFSMLKFRSMYVDSGESIHREAIAKYMSGQTVSGTTEDDLSYKVVDDPRVTKVGRFLRKTSIDELPQFFNVLRGEMTLVGPRPPLPYEVERYSQHDWLRLQGKPGLTGYWQVYGRSRVTFSSMVEMDIEYLQKQSLREDMKLIFLTVPVMVMGQGGA
jgi:lipopolysaccharide/colanic/teichoic acid biosynthesis glycosyltransferase